MRFPEFNKASPVPSLVRALALQLARLAPHSMPKPWHGRTRVGYSNVSTGSPFDRKSAMYSPSSVRAEQRTKDLPALGLEYWHCPVALMLRGVGDIPPIRVTMTMSRWVSAL